VTRRFHQLASRREFLGRSGASVAASVLAAGAWTSKAKAAGSPRALALIGDRYHNADYIRVALTRLFKSLNLPVEFTINDQEISAQFLRDYQLFICFRDGMIWPGGYLGPDAYSYTAELENSEDWPEAKPEGWIKEEQGRAIRDFVQAGNGFYAFHNSSHVSLYSQAYRDVMGGAYIGHPPLRPFKVLVANREHPITRGVGDFVVTDEQHYVTYDKDPANVILRSENLDGLNYENHGTRAIAGWAYDFGRGRVAFTAVGHTLHAMWQPEYFKIQQNTVRWLLKMI
jgi:hypothetical protein